LLFFLFFGVNIRRNFGVAQILFNIKLAQKSGAQKANFRIPTWAYGMVPYFLSKA